MIFTMPPTGRLKIHPRAISRTTGPEGSGSGGKRWERTGSNRLRIWVIYPYLSIISPAHESLYLDYFCLKDSTS